MLLLLQVQQQLQQAEKQAHQESKRQQLLSKETVHLLKAHMGQHQHQLQPADGSMQQQSLAARSMRKQAKQHLQTAMSTVPLLLLRAAQTCTRLCSAGLVLEQQPGQAGGGCLALPHVSSCTCPRLARCDTQKQATNLRHLHSRAAMQAATSIKQSSIMYFMRS